MIEKLVMAIPNVVVQRDEYCSQWAIEQKDREKFERITGIKKTRRNYGSTTAMMISALKKAKLDVSEIRSVIVVTQSPDLKSPCMAVEAHAFLELDPSVLAFDLNQACAGWVVGLHLARRLLGKTLLICADKLRYRKGSLEYLIFSDSVSMTIVEGGMSPPVKFFTNGNEASRLFCDNDGHMNMDGDFVFDFVTKQVPPMVTEFNSKMVEQNVFTDYFVPHQANLSMNKLLASRSGFKEKWLCSIEEYGNQSMNSIPMAIASNEEKALGKDLLLCGFGAGMSVAMMSLRWSRDSICKVVEI